MIAAQQSRFSRIVDQFEEALIAFLLGLMTLITFANVIVRYVFNSNMLWAVESTVYLFAWLVLLGVGYGIKHSIHIGVDVVVKLFSPKVQKTLTLIAVAACLLFAMLLLKGSWDYWSPFIGKQAFLEVEDIPMPWFLQFLSDLLNDGERYEKIPRFIPYLVLPISSALMLWRFSQAAWYVWTDQIDMLVANHEVDELLEQVAAKGDAGDNAGGANH